MFDEILAEWGKTFDDFAFLVEYRKKVVETKFTAERCYKVEDFTADFADTADTLSKDIPADVPYYEEYGMGANGLPYYCRTIDKTGLPIFAGFYRYTHDAVEFVQYNLFSKIPSLFERMVLTEGRKKVVMKVAVNGGGTRFSGMTSQQAIEVAKKDVYSIFLSTENYEYDGGRIVKDISHHRVPGLGEYVLKGYYKYDADGTLLEITDISADGQEQLRYYHWDESEGLQALSDKLALEMAEAIVRALSEEQLQAPLAILQLSYHYADSYMPILNPLSVKEKNEVIAQRTSEIWQWLFLINNGLYGRPLKGIEKTFAQFMNQVDRLEAHDMARNMLQKTSALLTTSRLFGRIPVDTEFFVYAIDHSIEGHDAEDFKAILLNCGMREEQYARWKERGWVRE